MKSLTLLFCFIGLVSRCKACFPIPFTPICIPVFLGLDPPSSDTLMETGHNAENNFDFDLIYATYIAPICKDTKADKTSMVAQTVDAITNILTVVEKNNPEVYDINLITAMAMLKVYDDKHDAIFQRRFKIDKLISDICSKQTTEGMVYCRQLTKNWELIHDSSVGEATLVKEAEGMANLSLLGKERVHLPKGLMSKCQADLLKECKAEKECRNTFLESSPSTQYVLSHQLFYRMLIQTRDCKSLLNYTDGHANDKICAKMYKESQLISHSNYPGKLRDLLVENIALCGFKGYPNFFRSDWLSEVLKWNVKNSESCLTTDNINYGLGMDVQKSCDTHFMSVSLIALAGFWDHIQRTC